MEPMTEETQEVATRLDYLTQPHCVFASSRLCVNATRQIFAGLSPTRLNAKSPSRQDARTPTPTPVHLSTFVEKLAFLATFSAAASRPKSNAWLQNWSCLEHFRLRISNFGFRICGSAVLRPWRTLRDPLLPASLGAFGRSIHHHFVAPALHQIAPDCGKLR